MVQYTSLKSLTSVLKKVSDYLTEGQEVPVKVLEIDRQGRVRLSMKEAVETPAEGEAPAAE